jgi:hypothetical protein
LPSDTTAKFFKRWIESVKRTLDPTSYRRYKGIVEKFLPWLGVKAYIGIQHLSSTDIVRFRDHLALKHSPKSVNLALGCISSARLAAPLMIGWLTLTKRPEFQDSPMTPTKNNKGAHSPTKNFVRF